MRERSGGREAVAGTDGQVKSASPTFDQQGDHATQLLPWAPCKPLLSDHD